MDALQRFNDLTIQFNELDIKLNVTIGKILEDIKNQNLGDTIEFTETPQYIIPEDINKAEGAEGFVYLNSVNLITGKVKFCFEFDHLDYDLTEIPLKRKLDMLGLLVSEQYELETYHKK